MTFPSFSTISYISFLDMRDIHMTRWEEGIKIARETYGKDVSDFEDVWDRYGKQIETHG